MIRANCCEEITGLLFIWLQETVILLGQLGQFIWTTWSCGYCVVFDVVAGLVVTGLLLMLSRGCGSLETRLNVDTGMWLL